MDTPDVAEVQRAVGERYEVLELAGAGGMGAVYRARHCALGHFVAIKTLPPEVMESGMRQERFKREAGLAAHLSHPNIVPVFEFEQRAGVAYLIMPFVRGHSLGSMLGDGTRLALVDLMRVLVDIGAALDFVHPRGVIHRDVKPANIMIEDDTGRALLTDFGVAYVSPTTSGALTAVGSAIGTPDYMAPEQAIGRRIDGRADLYALAIVAYESLTGTLPMLSESPDAPARALHEARPEIAPRVAAALMAPLAQQPADRPASAAQWLAQIKRASSGARRQALLLGTIVVGALLVVGKIALGRHEAAVAPASVAVMPFLTQGQAPYSVDKLPDWFVGRFSPVPKLSEVVSFGRVLDQTGQRPVTRAKADSVARQLGAKYFLNPVSLEFQGRSVTLTASLYETGRADPRATVDAQGPVDSLSPLMDLLWAKILGAEFRPNSNATIPRGKEAIAAYLNADVAFGHADYDKAQVLYDSVTRRDPDFAPAYLRRVLVLAQVAPQEDSLRAAMRSARGHWGGLTVSDSLLLDGYVQLVERGDGIAALEQFREAVNTSAGSIWARFALGEFYYYFGQLFDIEHPLDSARAAFDSVRAIDSRFAAAIANSISLAHLQGQDDLARRLIREYHGIDSASVVAEVIGLADTFLFHKRDALKVVNTLERHDFIVLEFLAFQAAQAPTPEEQHGPPARRILRELARKARSPYERNLALRFGLAADLRQGWIDSARARLASSGAEATERDEWLILAAAAGVPSLGDGAAARQRAAERIDADSSATLTWLLGATAAGDPSRYMRVLERQAHDSAPLPFSLLRDLQARRLLAAGDTAGALQKWDEAMRRYAVLAAPFGLVASLWPLRRDLVRIAALRKDTTRVDRGCRSFDALVGFVDQIVKPAVDSVCDAWRRQRR
jgi:serine/threonine protein kinase/tetratricopeptide (TPR) repeat protein